MSVSLVTCLFSVAYMYEYLLYTHFMCMCDHHLWFVCICVAEHVYALVLYSPIVYASNNV